MDNVNLKNCGLKGRWNDERRTMNDARENSSWDLLIKKNPRQQSCQGLKYGLTF